MKQLALIAALLPLSVSADPIIASRTLPAGTIITVEDIITSDDNGDLTDIVGLQTRMIIYEGKPIHPSRLTPAQLVNRNQIVPITYETPFMVIQTEGRALEAGQAGHIIRVMNISSKATISGRISHDGTVRVLGK